MSVRRLAAIDMHGLHGTSRRRRLVLAEFVSAAVALIVIGVTVVVAARAVTGRLVGCWMIGAGLNYVPLAVHAPRLRRPSVLAAELEGVDVSGELRRYGVLQLSIFVPLALVVIDARNRRGRD